MPADFTWKRYISRKEMGLMIEIYWLIQQRGAPAPLFLLGSPTVAYPHQYVSIYEEFSKSIISTKLIKMNIYVLKADLNPEV